MRNLVLMFLLLSSSSVARCQESDSLGGASRPIPSMRLDDTSKYNRVHQLALRYLLLDRAAEAEQYLNAFQLDHPEDAESSFLLGAIYARTSQPSRAVAALRQALKCGLPPERILAGPRALFAPLTDDPFYAALFARSRNTPIHGPLVGNVTDHSASFWLRTVESSLVTVVVDGDSTTTNRVVASQEGDGTTTVADDFTCVVRINDLQPDTRYQYRIRIGHGPFEHQPHWQVRTFPAAGKAARFSLAFGGGAGFVPDHERMWETIQSYHPAAMLLLGDNVYIDDPESAEMQRYTYYRRQSRPEWRTLTAQTPVFSIWDDHDFSTNDSWGGPLIDLPAWKRDLSWTLFTQNWANPGYGGGPEQPGCWYRFAIADVDYFMLDCRYYRTDPNAPDKSMLGPVQLQWLREQLAASTATFKVICSSVPWDFRTKGDSLDTWNGFQEEREAIFTTIESNRIEGVLLMSADRHRSDAWRIARPNGYDLYEFNSSRLTNEHVHPTMEKAGALFSYNMKQSFGLVTFDTQGDLPRARYDVISIDGETVHSLEVLRSQLTFE